MSEHSPQPPAKIEYGTVKSCVAGFLLSIVLTLAAYFLVARHLLSGWALDCSIGILAIGQAVVQLLLFLNLSKEPKPRWNLIVFFFMILVIILLVGGSLWIISNLNYNLMMK